MRLYTYWRSSSAWRVRIALAWKGLPYEAVPVHLLEGGGRQHEAAFRALNASEQVPVLELDEDAPDGRPLRLAQSMAILEYLDERYPTPPLLPTHPWMRARARQMAEIVNSGIQPMQNLYTQQRLKEAGADAEAWTRHFIARGLTALEQAATETAKTYLVGDALSLADVYLVPQLYGARRFGVDLAPYPTLVRVDAACVALPAFESAHPDAQPDAPKP